MVYEKSIATFKNPKKKPQKLENSYKLVKS